MHFQENQPGQNLLCPPPPDPPHTPTPPPPPPLTHTHVHTEKGSFLKFKNLPWEQNLSCQQKGFGVKKNRQEVTSNLPCQKWRKICLVYSGSLNFKKSQLRRLDTLLFWYLYMGDDTDLLCMCVSDFICDVC